MPEGDTIWRAARVLHAALAGRVVTRFDARAVAVAAAARRLQLVGCAVDRVESRGKHLLFAFAGGVVLHTHQGMRGSWRLQPPGEVRGRALAVAVLETAEVVAVCRHAPVVELLPERALFAHPSLARLGPDLLGPGFDPAVARARLRARGGRSPVGEALLDQVALAGIGNVYKSEVLFLCGVAPTTGVDTLDDAALDRLIATASRLLRRNLGPGRRRTTSGTSREPLHVYARAGQPCRVCATPIVRIVQGEQARSTYFCPSCQQPRGPGVMRPGE
jgi:endonuclease-8